MARIVSEERRERSVATEVDVKREAKVDSSG